MVAPSGWKAIYLDSNGIDRFRPLAGWQDIEPKDKSAFPVMESCVCTILGQIMPARDLPNFVGIVGPDQDSRSVLREAEAAVRAKLPKAKEPARDEPISFDDRGRFRHG